MLIQKRQAECHRTDEDGCSKDCHLAPAYSAGIYQMLILLSCKVVKILNVLFRHLEQYQISSTISTTTLLLSSIPSTLSLLR